MGHCGSNLGGTEGRPGYRDFVAVPCRLQGPEGATFESRAICRLAFLSGLLFCPTRLQHNPYP